MSDQPETLYCANHPQTPTGLRCNRCEKPICVKCAVRTPIGYRCKECVRGQQKVFETATWIDYPLLFGVVAILAGLGALGASFIGFFTIFLAPIAGGMIAEAARFVTRKRRSKLLYRLAIIAAVVGCLPFLSMNLLSLDVLGIVWQGVYLFMMTSTLYYRLSGIKIR
jgi:B-box zinc finger